MTCIRCKHQEQSGSDSTDLIESSATVALPARIPFPSPARSPLDGTTSPMKRPPQIVTLLLEGVSVRAASRLLALTKARFFRCF